MIICVGCCAKLNNGEIDFLQEYNRKIPSLIARCFMCYYKNNLIKNIVYKEDEHFGFNFSYNKQIEQYEYKFDEDEDSSEYDLETIYVNQHNIWGVENAHYEIDSSDDDNIVVYDRTLINRKDSYNTVLPNNIFLRRS